MIKIYVDSNGGGLIWFAEDWHELRSQHHIIGNLVGNLNSVAKNAKILSLPCQLLREEVTLLLELNLGKLIRIKDLNDKAKEKFDAYKEQIKKEQTDSYKKDKEKKVHSKLDAIIENLKAKKDLLAATNKEEGPKKEIDREQVLQNELDKIVTPTGEQILVQRFLGDPWLEVEDLDPSHWKYPECTQDKLKYSVYKDLWQKKYVITDGSKFAGDYLVYSGDPSKFHAQFIVICKNHTEKFRASELAMLGRVGSNAKKTVVLASLDSDNKVVYQSLGWSDIVI